MIKSSPIQSLLWFWFRTVLCCLISISCQNDETESTDPIVVGALLPFSGEQAAMGLNIEQAITLAAKDINAAGGVNGRPIQLMIRDSNSGTKLGYEQAKDLIENHRIKYLIGPEENTLAKQLVTDIKNNNMLNLLPGIAAPSVRETGQKGAWIRLAPSPMNVGCAMATKAMQQGRKTAAVIVADDDYQTLVSAAFNTAFSQFGGISLGTIIIKDDKDSYLNNLSSLRNLDADVYVMLTYPKTGSILAQDWVLGGLKGNWYLAPTLHSEMFLKNIPFKEFEEVSLFSAALSLASECNAHDERWPETLDCKRNTESKFAKHYQEAWQGDLPSPTSRFYYDAVILLALSLQFAFDQDISNPTPAELRSFIEKIAEPPGKTLKWSELKSAFKHVSSDTGIAYSGVGAEYNFTFRGDLDIGEADHHVMDIWTIRNADFVWSDSLGLLCADLSSLGGRVYSDADEE